ncbi:MAG: arylsulfatase, partial [Armatimonadetes bacterium]|nr:arylsulfatase [Armatimonadota bacterium]
RNRERPFFLYFALHDIHVPRVPHPRFVGQTALGPRGDAMVEADWSVGEVLKVLDRLRLTRDTLVLFTSDNGPVVDDGYRDDAVAKLGEHRPAGPLRGGKYSAFEGGTRVPFLARWPARIRPGVSHAVVSQVDFLASFAALTGQALGKGDGPDSQNALSVLLGESQQGRAVLVQQAGVLTYRAGRWKYIEPGRGPRRNMNTNTETGQAPTGQLYDLEADPGETRDLAAEQPDRVREMAAALAAVRAERRGP